MFLLCFGGGSGLGTANIYSNHPKENDNKDVFIWSSILLFESTRV